MIDQAHRASDRGMGLGGGTTVYPPADMRPSAAAKGGAAAGGGANRSLVPTHLVVTMT